jgi:16S rRNA (guanine966-N2)-methyltransferase
LRIVGGSHKGRNIEVSKAFSSRPTTDFAKEGLFNILANHFDFEDITVLDLFAGTGSISFEFASRGCRNIDLVDINTRSVQFIGKISNELEIEGIRPVHLDAFKFISICKKQYNLIFADPPYEMKNLKAIPDHILSHNLLLPGGWFILEHPRAIHFNNNPSCFDERRYGNVHFSFFKS